MTAFVLWAMLLGAPSARAQPQAPATELRRLDAERDAAQQALDDALAQRRKAMQESEAWTLSTDEERRERMDALRDEFRDHERRLKQEYEAARRQIGRGS